jgi:hypothetical protein
MVGSGSNFVHESFAALTDGTEKAGKIKKNIDSRKSKKADSLTLQSFPDI